MKVSELMSFLNLGEMKSENPSPFDLTLDQAESMGNRNVEMLQHIQLGLIQLYQRFDVFKKRLSFTTRVGKQTYKLSKDNAIQQNADGFILDTADNPFNDDIIKILAIYNEDGYIYDVNDEHSPFLFIRAPNTIFFNASINHEKVFNVFYKSIPQKLLINDSIEAQEQEVDIPQFMIEPLLSYVDYRINKSKTTEGALQLSQIAYQQYEMACARIDNENLLHDSDMATCIKPDINGWC